jgi:predicted membrane-bound mannosyltransferase
MNSSQRYENYLAKKKFQQSGVEDLSGPVGSGVAKTDWFGRSNLTQNDQQPEQVAGAKDTSSSGMSSAAGAAQSIAKGNSPIDAAGSGLVTYGAATANPYMVGAGLALSTASNISDSKNQQAQDRYVAEVQRVKARQDAIDRLAQIGQNLKA